MVVCECCNTLVDSRKAVLIENSNTYTNKYICKECNTVDAAEIFKVITVIKKSRNQFKKSIVEFYNNNGYLTQKQIKSIKLTTNELINYHMLDNNFKELQFLILNGTLTDKQELKIIDILFNNGQYDLLKRILRTDIHAETINNLLNSITPAAPAEKNIIKKGDFEKMNNKTYTMIKGLIIAAVLIVGAATIKDGIKLIEGTQEKKARILSSINAAAAQDITIPEFEIIDGYNLENNKYMIMDQIKAQDIEPAEIIKRGDNTHNAYYNIKVNGIHKILIIQGIDSEYYPALLIDADQMPQSKIIDNLNAWAYGKSGAAVQI